jgi:poly-gamma-glutamate capsule biosynthesis protein CapA/YwtB (metallophosphatase superfamily)
MKRTGRGRRVLNMQNRWYDVRVWIVCVVLLLITSAEASHAAVQGDSAAIIMRFAGDCLLGAHYEEAASQNPGMAFEGFDLFRTADIAVVNLENPITTRGTRITKPFNFRMNPRFVQVLTQAGIGVVSIANNHVFDYGEQGLLDTFSYLDSAHIRYVGAGRSRSDAHRPYFFSRAGRDVGILGYYGGGEARVATDRQSGVARRELGAIIQDVRALRHADPGIYIVVILHWGTEKADTPDPVQQEFARALIDGGVDAVIGHHPHVLQGIERYKNGVIVYSLGNFLFGGNGRHTYDTGVFEIALHLTGPVFRFIPVGVRNWRLRVLEGEDADRVTSRVRFLSNIFPSSTFTH